MYDQLILNLHSSGKLLDFKITAEEQINLKLYQSLRNTHTDKITLVTDVTITALTETAAAVSSSNTRPIFLRKGVYSCCSKKMEISVCFRLASLISLEHTSSVQHSPQSSRNLCCKTGSGSEFSVAHIQCGEKLIRTFLLGLQIQPLFLIRADTFLFFYQWQLFFKHYFKLFHYTSFYLNRKI